MLKLPSQLWRCVLPVLTCVLIVMAAWPAQAKPAVVFDAATGEVLMAEDAGMPWYPASLTKLMTAYLSFKALADGKLRLDSQVTVSAAASKPPPSKIGLKPGSQVSVDFALRALLVYSANDMAVVLAEAVSGSQQKFAELMNATARGLGMSGSHFVNPHGLYNPNQITTARDMALLSYTLLKQFPNSARYFKAPFVQVGKKKLRNRNYLLKIYDAADGMKTGFICPSGFNLVGSATQNGRKLVTVVFGTRSGKARAYKARTLLQAGFGLRGRSSIGQLRNTGGTPPNLRGTVCAGKGLQLVRAEQLGGWGATFGKFKSAAEAEAVIEAMRTARLAGLPAAGSGVARIPYTKDFVPVMWNTDQAVSGALCGQVRASGGSCDVVSPATFADFANLMAREKGKEGASASATAAGVASPSAPAKPAYQKKERKPRASK